MRPIARATIAASTLVLLAGCDSSGDTPGAEPAESSEPANECVDAAAMGDALAEGANGTKITPEETQAVKAADLADAYYIAMSFTVEGVDEPQVGVWASNSLEPGGGTIMSVDAFAKEFTDWPDAEEVADIPAAGAGIDAAKSCITG